MFRMKTIIKHRGLFLCVQLGVVVVLLPFFFLSFMQVFILHEIILHFLCAYRILILCARKHVYIYLGSLFFARPFYSILERFTDSDSIPVNVGAGLIVIMLIAYVVMLGYVIFAFLVVNKKDHKVGGRATRH